MRAPVLLVLALLVAGAAPQPALADPPAEATRTAPAVPASPAAPTEAAPSAEPYRQRMTAGHRVQSPRAHAWLTPQGVARLKAATALCGAALLLWGALVNSERETRLRRRLRDAALLGLGAVAGCGAWNFFAFRYPEFGHDSDSYHAYVGSKYLRELGEQRLYLCAAVADVEAGLRSQVERRYPRQRASDDATAATTAITHPEACKAHFSSERWASFQHDIGWFRERVPVRRWQEIQSEPGYAATPAWTALAGSLANRVPATDAGIFALRLLDPLLLAGMWSAVVLAFGWRAACVALLFWGTHFPAPYDATGGSFLRETWLVASVTALCALRGGRPATAGVLLGVAIALRVSPLLVLAALAFREPRRPLDARRFRLQPETLPLLAGALAAAGALVAFSLLAGGGLPAWDAWFAIEPAPEPHGWILLALLAVCLVSLARVALREAAWVIGVIGLGLVAILGANPGDSSAALLAFGLLWLRRPGIGVALCLLALAGGWIAGSGPPQAATLSSIRLASVLFVAGATASLLWPRAPA